MTTTLWFTKDGVDLTEGIELRNGRAKIGGWSTHEVWHNETYIADLYCGNPIYLLPGYGFRYEEVEGEADV